MLTVEQVMAANKANVDTFFGLTHKVFEGIEKLVELNLAASKAALADAASQTQAILGVKDAQELLSVQSSLLEPLSEKAAAYSRSVYEIASSAGAEFGKTLEVQTAEGQKKFLSLVENTAANAPAGSETAVAFMKGAVAAANSALESAQKSVKQATELVESNFNAVAASAVNASKTSAKKR